jgi:hypothetical protein
VIGAAALSAAALAFVPISASSHTDNLYTWAYADEESEFGSFATTSKVDAALTLLPATVDVSLVTGTEICDDQGYAVSHDGEMRLLLWDHTTGALTGGTQLSMDPGDDETVLNAVQELDTLADCTLLTLAFYGNNTDSAFVAISSIDPVSGLVTPVVPLTNFDRGGLATDAAGTTYVFATDNVDTQVAVVNLEAGTVGPLTAMDGISARFQSTNFTWAADFDSAGALWLVTGIDSQQEYYLLSFPVGSDYASTQPAPSGILPYENAAPLVDEPITLAADHGPAIIPAAPTLPDTGSEFPMGLALTALLVLGAGAVLTVTGRRRTA